jgi:hypothetical protein
MSVGGQMLSRSEVWRDLSWSLGDAAATALCLWCDAQPDPTVEVRALCAVLDLAARERRATKRYDVSLRYPVQVYLMSRDVPMGVADELSAGVMRDWQPPSPSGDPT